MSVKIPAIKDMMKAGLHFGHKSSKWNPKMEPYIYGIKNGIHIFDLDRTRESLKSSLELIQKTAARGGVVLFLGTKKQARPIVEKYAREVEMPFVTERWIGGTITNFEEIYKLVKKLDSLEKRAEESEYEKKYTKKERGLFTEEMDNLKRNIGGIREMKKVPDLVYIAGVKDEKTAVKEAKRKGVKTVGIVDTNADPDDVVETIAANDDAIKSIEMITSLVADAVKEGKKDKDKADKEEQVKPISAEAAVGKQDKEKE